MDWHKLPEGMRSRRQWICTDENKEPLDVHTGMPASCSDPATWSTFEEATKAAIWNGLDIAYVLDAEDPFSIIDLDNKEYAPAPEEILDVHRDIIQRADTYIERSISGTGYHVIVLGKPIKPVKTPHIEQYGTLRYMICTGDSIKDFEPADGRELLDLIDKHFGSLSVALAMDELPDYIEGVDVEPDDVVIARAMNADNGDKFERLYQGDQSDYDFDHSRADMALLNLLCFYTPHNEQVRRIFRASALYRPDQKNKQVKYMNYSIGKWRGENMPLDMSNLKFPTLNSEIPTYDPLTTLSGGSAESALDVKVEDGSDDIELPPGLIGDVARFAYKASYHQVKEGAVVAAIGMVAGMIARSYHVNGLGLNQYLIFLAGSGVGKEGAKKAIRKLQKAMASKIPSLVEHPVVGSGDFSSGISLVKELADTPCFVAMMGEVGQTFQLLLDPRAPSHVKELKRALTEAWSESGAGGHLSSRRYSDKAKNSKDVDAPALSLMGESVPEEFYKALTSAIAADGFLPRFLIWEYPGDRGYPNRDRLTQCPEDLVQRLCDLYVNACSITAAGAPVNIKASPGAGLILTSYEDFIDECIRAEPKASPTRAVLNRCYEKALRLAGLFAAADNPFNPLITAELAKIAIRLVERSDKRMLAKFKDGEISSGGNSEDQFVDLVQRAIRAYIEMTPTKRIIYKCPAKIADIDVVPSSYLRDWLKRRNAIKEHKLGPMKATEMAIRGALEDGVIVKVGLVDKRNWGVNQDMFRVAEGFKP